ncbi:MAG: ArsA family ATPase, partial [Micromonospora sp.]
AEVLRAHAALVQQAVRERRVAARFTEAFPAVPSVSVTAQPADVHDVDGLRTIGEAISRP